MAIEITKKIVHNSLQLRGFDYNQPGAYFVTMCTNHRACYFGNIVDGIMISFPISEIVREIWLEIPKKFQCVDLDTFIIMPNHIHGIIIINRYCRSLIHQTHKFNCSNKKRMGLINQASKNTKDWILMKNSNRTLGKIVRYFKAKSAKIIHDSCFQRFKWQRNYYEHVVRSNKELNGIREYIVNNPIKWAFDRENLLSKNFNMDLDKYFKDIFEK